MAGNEKSKLKLLYLMDIFMNKTDESHPITAGGLCDLLEKRGVMAERKSIYKDIEILREFGLDIVSASAKQGYFLGSRQFELAELRVLADAVQAAGFISMKKTRELVQKIEAQTSDYQARQLHSQVYVDSRKKTDNESLYYIIEDLDRAIQQQRRVHFFYSRRRMVSSGSVRREEKEFTVSPYALIWSDDHYYLVGNYAKYDNLAHFRIDRIRKLDLTQEPARHFSQVSPYKTAFNSADYVNSKFNMYSGEPKPVELKCSNELLEIVLDRFGDRLRIGVGDETHFTVRIHAVLNDGFIGWLMQFGSGIEVLMPESLREQVKQKAKQICLLYE